MGLCGTAAQAIGYAVGGPLAEYLSWRYCFIGEAGPPARLGRGVKTSSRSCLLRAGACGVGEAEVGRVGGGDPILNSRFPVCMHLGPTQPPCSERTAKHMRSSSCSVACSPFPIAKHFFPALLPFRHAALPILMGSVLVLPIFFSPALPLPPFLRSRHVCADPHYLLPARRLHRAQVRARPPHPHERRHDRAHLRHQPHLDPIDCWCAQPPSLRMRTGFFCVDMANSITRVYKPPSPQIDLWHHSAHQWRDGAIYCCGTLH